MTGATSRVSVVIPARNAAPWIAETVRSVLAQEIPDSGLEILVVDDGSTDGTVEAAMAAAQDAGCRVRVLGGEGRGPSAARNVGWGAAAADWIQFLDSDDLLSRGKLAHQLGAAGAAGEDVAVLSSAWTDLVLDGAAWKAATGLRVPVSGGHPALGLISSEGFIPFAAALVRRAWLERVGGFDESWWLVEDVELQLRILEAGGNFVFLRGDAPMFFYRRRTGSLSTTDPRRFLDACLSNVDRAMRLVERDGAINAESRRKFAGHYASAARSYLAWDEARAGELFAAVRRLWPGYVPDRPPGLRILSRVLGFESAARFASRARRALGRTR